MFDDLNAYFYENIATAYMQYKEAREKPVAGRSNDIRLSINAATALYHLREHLPTQHQKPRKFFSTICPDYDLLGDIVNASKHKTITRGRTPQVISANSIYEEFVQTEYRDDKGIYMHHTKLVMVDLVNGNQRDILDILTNVINMWITELKKIGVISGLNQFPAQQPHIPPRSNEGNSTRLDLEILRGVRFKQRCKIQRYNYDTGKIEPIDISGWKIQGHIYKPSYTVDYSLINNKTGEKIIKEIDLTDEQSREYFLLTSDNDRKVFLERIADDQGILKEIICEIQKTSKR